MSQISIAMDVPSIDQAMAFYTEALGCSEKKRTKNSGIVSTGNVDIYFLEKEGGTNPLLTGSDERSYERHWTPVHLDFLVDDVKGMAAKVIELGGTREGGDEADWGEIAYCADPFGNGFCIIKE